MIERDTIYIDGAWVPSAGTGTIDVIDAATGEVMGRIPDGTPADVDRAVAAARAAFPAWSATRRRSGPSTPAPPGGARRPHGRDLATLIATEVGHAHEAGRR